MVSIRVSEADQVAVLVFISSSGLEVVTRIPFSELPQYGLRIIR